MSRTFPRASFRGCFSLFCCCSLVIFTYTGHDVHRRGHGRRRPLRGLSVVPSLISTLSPRHSSVVYCPQDSAARWRGVVQRDDAWRVILVKLQASRRRRRRGYVYPTRTPSPRHRISAGRARPGAARAPRPALIPKQYKAGRSKADRSLKPPPTLPTRLALGLALLGLLPSPEVVVPIVLVRRRRAPVGRVVALVEALAAALARREVLGPRLLAAVADLR